jgi:hypothetical protein
MIHCLSFAVLALPCMAQPSAGNLGGGAGQRSQLAVADCAEARDPLRCLGLQQARAACQSKRGIARRKCLREKLPPPDCRQAPDAQRCQTRQEAQAACQGQVGKALRSCLRNFQIK